MPIPPKPALPPISPVAYLAPGVFIEEVSTRPPRLMPIDATTAGLIGPTRTGPLGGPLSAPPALLASMADFERLHGDGQPLVHAEQTVPNLMWQAARAFFAEGGRRLRIVRVFRPDPSVRGAARDGIARLRQTGLLWSARSPGRAGNLRLRLTLRCGQRLGDGSIAPEPWATTRADLVASGPEGAVLGVWAGLSIDPAAAPADGRPWLFASGDGSAPDALPVIARAKAGLDVEGLLTTLRAWRLAPRTDLAHWADGVTLDLSLAGGHDGLPPGVAELGGATGLARFDQVDDVALLAAPVVTESERPAVHDLLIAHAQRQPGRTLQRLALLDAGPAATIDDLRSLRQRLDTRCAALFHPWRQGADGLLPPSAALAGLIARSERERGIWKSPGGEPLRSPDGLAIALSKDEQSVLNAADINTLIDLPLRGRLLWGARTLSSDPQWRYIPISRGIAALQTTIERGLGWTVFEPHDEALWARVRATIDTLLLALWRQGAFVGQKPEEACFVRCDRTTMTQADLDAGRLVVLIGVAPLKPAEFVMLKVATLAAGG